MNLAAFRFIREYTPTAFTASTVAFTMVCIFKLAVIAALLLHGMEIPQ